MKIVREWSGWKLFHLDKGKYLLVRYDNRLLEFKTLQIIVSAVDEAAAVTESEELMRTFEKKTPGPSSLINRLR